jgi:hypothetical protein
MFLIPEHEWVLVEAEEPTGKRIFGFSVQHYVCAHCGVSKIEGIVTKIPLTPCGEMITIRDSHEWPDPIGALKGLEDILSAKPNTGFIHNTETLEKILELKLRIPVICRTCGDGGIYNKVRGNWILSYNKIFTCSKVRMKNALG